MSITPVIADQIKALFKQSVGRDPRPDELDYLTKFVDEGGLQPFEANQIAQGLPEAQNRQLQQYGGQYEQALAGADQRIMGQAGDQLTSMFAQQGRPRSSGYTAAFANAARDLAIQRQPQIANFYGQGYGNIMGNYGQMAQGATNRGYGLRDEQRKRAWEIEDYYRKKNDTQDFLNMQGTRNLQGSLTNAGINVAASWAMRPGTSPGNTQATAPAPQPPQNTWRPNPNRRY